MSDRTPSFTSLPDAGESGRQIGPASKSEYAAGLKLVFCYLPPDARLRTRNSLLSAAARGQISFQGLLIARQQGQMRGAVWARAGAGRMASVWPPRVSGDDESGVTIRRLLDAMDGFLREHRVRLAQAFLDPADTEGAERLAAAGFHASTDLICMACPAQRVPSATPKLPISFQPFTPSAQQRLEEVVTRTYAGTQDYPELSAVCEAADALAAYRETGEHAPERWFFVRKSGQDIGCLLLTDHPHDSQCELLYMGLVPNARGHGYGGDMVRHALRIAAGRGRSQLVLGVGAANEPALRTYASSGFSESGRQAVLLKCYDHPD